MILYLAGDLTNSGYFVNTTGGFNKAGPGALTFNTPSYTIGTQAVNGGVVNLNAAQDNTFVAESNGNGTLVAGAHAKFWD
jgi:hypothetical protein